MKKLRDRSGETLLETLVSLLIIVLAMGFLVTSIATAVKINSHLDYSDLNFIYDRGEPEQKAIIIDGADAGTVEVYTDNGYYFYGD